MIPALAFWQAGAKNIDAGDQKASLVVRHPSSLGGAREVILLTSSSTRPLIPFVSVAGSCAGSPARNQSPHASAMCWRTTQGLPRCTTPSTPS